MKKIMILLVLLLLPAISAIEFDMKSNFSQGETLTARVSGNFLDNILFENVFFYRGHVRVPFLYDVEKINDEFYIYALLPQEQENYSIVIKNVRYMKGSQIIDDEIIKNFSVSNQTADFSVNPGFIVSSEDFTIKVQNLQDHKISLNLNLFSGLESEDTITLMSGEIKKIYFSIENLNQPVSDVINLSTENLQYEIPVYIFEIGESQKNEEEIFRFSPPELEASVPTDHERTRTIYLYNLGQDDLEDIFLSVSEDLEDYVSLSTERIEELEAGSNIKIKLSLFSEEEILLEGKIRAETVDKAVSLPVTLNFIKDYKPADNGDIYDPPTTETCSELGGIICASDKECSIDLVDAKDDKCCLGSCEEIKKSSTGKIIAGVIIAAILIFAFWFFRTKYKGAKKGVDLLKIGKEK